MPIITIQVTEENMADLKAKAEHEHLTLEDFASQSLLRSLYVSKEDIELFSLMDEIIDQNQEIYRRLA